MMSNVNKEHTSINLNFILKKAAAELQTVDLKQVIEGCKAGQSKSCSSPAGPQKMIQDMKDLFLNGKDTDVTLNVRDRQLHAHRNILSARSPVFGAMLQHDMTEKRTGNVDIEDCDPEIFRNFLLYLYSSEMDDLTASNVLQLYNTADKYDVQDMKEVCREFINNNISVELFYDVVRLAHQYNELEMLQKATEFFARNLEKIIVSVDWQNFLKKNPLIGNELYIKALKYHGVLKCEINDV